MFTDYLNGLFLQIVGNKSIIISKDKLKVIFNLIVGIRI